MCGVLVNFGFSRCRRLGTFLRLGGCWVQDFGLNTAEWNPARPALEPWVFEEPEVQGEGFRLQ